MKTKLLITCLITSSFLFAQNIFKDDLSTYTAGQVLSGQGSWTNNSTTGGLGGCAGVGCTNATVDSRVMTYLNYGSTTQALTILPNKDGIGREIIPSITDGVFYVGMVINISNTAVSANDFFRVVNGIISSVGFRMYVQDTGEGNNKYKIGIKKAALSNSTEFAPDLLDYNVDNLIILKYEYGSSIADDVLSVYINPIYASGEPVTPSASTNIGEDQADDIDRIAFRLNQTQSMPSGAASLISVARTWFDLGFIPLSIEQFDAASLTVIGSQVSKGLLSINSNMAISNAKLNIYTITGQLIENKTISLEATINDIAINPIRSSSVYIVELLTENGTKFTKKITTN
jgi:hypothetical protein